MAKKSKLWDTHIKRGTPYKLTLLRGYYHWLNWNGEYEGGSFEGPTEKDLIGEYTSIQDARMVAYAVMSKHINKDVAVLVKYAGYDETVGVVKYSNGGMIWVKSANKSRKSHTYHILNRDGTLGKGWTN